ncbi:MAG: M20/M25/M40 family metallo-hydrolase [Spirochaetales bacterium]|nr:M20/M25/M40 family metallo-hydrolase [Spirochaetales bacterium]
MDLLDIFKNLVAIDSPSFEEDRVALFVEQKLLASGFSTRYDEAGNLYGYLEGEGNALLLNTHMDTVDLAVGARVVVEDGIIRSDGTTALGADDKAAVAALLHALEKVVSEDRKHPPLVVLFTTAEETGLAGAKQVDRSLLDGVAFGYTFDASGPVGGAIIQASWHDRLDVVIGGKAAHAGFKPEEGVSAIRIGSEAIAAMHLLRIDEETTANVGSFVAPGATNVVNAEATISFEARSLDEEKIDKQIAHMVEILEEKAASAGGTVHVHHHRLYEGYRHQADTPVVKRFIEACDVLKIPVELKRTQGGSDANIFNGLGIPTLTCSVGYENAHSKEEHIPLVELERLASLIEEIIVG